MAEEPKNETTTTEIADTDLHKELEAALNEQDGQEETPDNPAQDNPPDNADKGENGGKDAETQAEAEEPAKPTIDDALMERAVKAGISLADARSFASPEALERICTALEAKGATTGADNPAGDDKGDEGVDGGFNPESIPELSEDEYDADLVKVFNGLRSLVIQQGETIKALEEAGKAAAAEAAKKSAEAEEAAKAKAEAEKAAALEKRKSLRLAAPGGVPGKTRQTGGEDGDDAELIAELERKFGG